MVELIDSNYLYDYWVINDESLDVCCGVLVNKISEKEKLVIYIKDRRGDFNIPMHIDELNNAFIIPIDQLVYIDYSVRENMDKEKYIDFTNIWNASLEIRKVFLKFGISIPLKKIFLFMNFILKIINFFEAKK